MVRRRSRVTALRSCLVGIGFFLMGSVSDAWLLKQPVGWSLALLDDVLIACVAGLLVFLYERQQTRNTDLPPAFVHVRIRQVSVPLCPV